MQETKATYSLQVLDVTLKKILSLNLVPEAKIILLTMLVRGEVSSLLENVCETSDSPLVDIDFGRTALKAVQCDKSQSFDLITLSPKWMEQYVREWFEVSLGRKEDGTDGPESGPKGNPPTI